MNTNKPIRKVGIVLRPSSPELKGVFLQTREMLEDSGIEAMLESISGGMIELLGRDFAKIASQCDGFMSLGGRWDTHFNAKESFFLQFALYGDKHRAARLFNRFYARSITSIYPAFAKWQLRFRISSCLASSCV